MLNIHLVAVCILCVFQTIYAQSAQPTTCTGYPTCPVLGTPYPCDALKIVPADNHLDSWWSPYASGLGDSAQFSAGEFYQNSNGALNTGTIGYVLDFTVLSGTWYPNYGFLQMQLSVMDGSTSVGFVSLTSYNFYPLLGPDSCNASTNIWYTGGDVLVEFNFTTNTANTAFYNVSQTVTFTQNNNMPGYWPCSGGVVNTVTDRLFNFTEWYQAPNAPFFGSSYGTNSENYDAVVILWGSSGYDYATTHYYDFSTPYPGPNMGMDLAFGLQCSTEPSLLPKFVSSHPCPGCPHAQASAACDSVTVKSSSKCASLSVTSPGSCSQNAFNF